jgi:hypothetical protein
MAESAFAHGEEIEPQVKIPAVDFNHRLKNIEDKLAATKKASPLDWLLDVIKVLLPGIVLAVVGYFLNDTVRNALQEKQLQLDAIKEMRTLTTELQQPNITRDQAQAKAAELASFGEYAVPFFINVGEIGNEYGIAGAKQGLRMVARSKPKPVCEALTSVIRNRTGLYQWQSHLSAVEVIGAIPCPNSLKLLAEYQANLDSVSTLAKWVAGTQPDQREFEKIKAQIQDTLDRLKRPAP